MIANGLVGEPDGAWRTRVWAVALRGDAMTAKDVDFADPEFLAQLEVLRQHYVQGMPGRRTAFMQAWADCADGTAEPAWQGLRDVAHKLSGTAPCYGLEDLGVAARELDRLLSGRPPCRVRAQVQSLVARVQGLLDASIAPG